MSPRRNRSARPRKPRENGPVCHRPYSGEVTDCGNPTETVRWSRHWRFVTCPNCKREGAPR